MVLPEDCKFWHSFAMEPLEDDFRWVLRKALKGGNLAPAEAAERAELPAADVLALSRGRFSEETARRAAPVLGLDAEAFVALPGYHPQVALPAGLHRHAVPFDGGFVNAWLLCLEGRALLVDAGPDPLALSVFLREHSFSRLDVAVTHPHGDHTGGLPALRGIRHTLLAPVGAVAGLPGAVGCNPGESLDITPFGVLVLDLDGHWPGALGFLVDAFETPVCAVGDALFAGSLGGTPDPARHEIALDRIRREIMTLSDETILLPGHGPPTTVGLERRNNPFLA
jgi:glyoxylase-like metal-dependent hydrolase (beta-lactamase superfamily II)